MPPTDTPVDLHKESINEELDSSDVFSVGISAPFVHSSFKLYILYFLHFYLFVSCTQRDILVPYLPPPMAKESKSPLIKKEFSPVHLKHCTETEHTHTSQQGFFFFLNEAPNHIIYL